MLLLALWVSTYHPLTQAEAVYVHDKRVLEPEAAASQELATGRTVRVRRPQVACPRYQVRIRRWPAGAAAMVLEWRTVGYEAWRTLQRDTLLWLDDLERMEAVASPCEGHRLAPARGGGW